MDNWYVYISRETLQVTRISPALDEDLDSHIHVIEKDLGISFINGPHLINDYVIYYDGTIIHFIKKEKSSEVVVPFYYSPLIVGSDIPNPDISILIENNTMTISLRKELIPYARTMYGNVDKIKQCVEFYVSTKNDPNGLLQIVYVDMMELITQNKVIVNDFMYDANEISIFTRKIFDSYGMV